MKDAADVVKYKGGNFTKVSAGLREVQHHMCMAKRVPENPEDPAQKNIAAAPTLQALAKISKDCKACDLWKVGISSNQNKAQGQVIYSAEDETFSVF